MNDIINYIMETPENTNPAILRQKLEEYAAKNGAAAKPVFFISSLVGSDHVVSYYDNPDRLATMEEVLDAYFAGTAVFIRAGRIPEPTKITNFFISDTNEAGRVLIRFNRGLSYDDRAIIYGSTEADLEAVMAKYLS